MKLHIIIVLLLTITSCSKYSFTDITETDQAGYQIGNVDNSDWNLNDNWSSKEKELFESEYPYCFDLTQTRDGFGIDPIESNVAATAFPNPARDVVNIHINLDYFDDIEFVMVDKNFNVVRSLSFGGSGNSFLFNITDLVSGNYYRVYYKIIRDNCAYSGHGDILKI